MLLLINKDRLEYTEIDLYIKYDQLDNSDVIELLSGLDRLHNEIVGQPLSYYYGRPFFPEFYYPFRNILEVQSIETGQSIRFRFKEGWKPSIRIRRKEVQIEVPRKIGIPLIVIYFLLEAASRYVEFRNQVLDNELKQLEIEMKKHELYREIEERRNSNNNSADFSRIQRQADRTVEFIFYNTSFSHVEINGVPLKEEPK